MARPIYPHELTDPDFQWLLSNYRESHPSVCLVEMSCLPIVLVLGDETVVRQESEVADAASTPCLPRPDAGQELADDGDLEKRDLGD